MGPWWKRGWRLKLDLEESQPATAPALFVFILMSLIEKIEVQWWFLVLSWENSTIWRRFGVLETRNIAQSEKWCFWALTTGISAETGKSKCLPCPKCQDLIDSFCSWVTLLSCKKHWEDPKAHETGNLHSIFKFGKLSAMERKSGGTVVEGHRPS